MQWIKVGKSACTTNGPAPWSRAEFKVGILVGHVFQAAAPNHEASISRVGSDPVMIIHPRV